MSEEDWDAGFGRSIAVYLNGQGIPDRDARGERVSDDSFLLCFSAHDEAIDFTLPTDEYGSVWSVVVDTNDPDAEERMVDAGATVTVSARSLVVLQRVG
jgi:glycogen operon protein